MGGKPKIALVGGPDVDRRLDLMRHLSPSFDVFAIGSNPALQASFDAAGFRYYTYPLDRTVNPLADMRATYRLVQLFRREQPAVVHAFATKPCVLARVGGWLAGVPVIVGTMGGLGTLYAPGDNGRNPRPVVRTLYEMGQRLASRLSDVTILHNPEDADMVVSRRIVPPDKLRLIPGSGVSIDIFDPESVDAERVREARDELGIAEGSLVVIMVARLVRAKGVLEYVEAAQLVQRTSRAIRFLLVGPWDRGSADALSESEVTRLSRHVDWIGMRNDVATLYALSDICVLPSHREGMPMALMEAAAMGLPLVATDVTGCRQVVENGRNGFLVPARDAAALASSVARLADESELRRRFGLASREMAVERFDSRSIARQIEGVYWSIIARKRSKHSKLQS